MDAQFHNAYGFGHASPVFNYIKTETGVSGNWRPMTPDDFAMSFSGNIERIEVNTDELEGLSETGNLYLDSISGNLDTYLPWLLSGIQQTNYLLQNSTGVQNVQIINTAVNPVIVSGEILYSIKTGIDQTNYLLQNSTGTQNTFITNTVTSPVPVSGTVKLSNFYTYLYDLLPTLDTNIYAAGDVLFDSVAITLPVGAVRGRVIGTQVLDMNNQSQPFDIVFLDSNISLGSLNAAVSISAANAKKVLGVKSVVAGDYVNLVNSKSATLEFGPLAYKLATNSLYVGGISRGAGTYSASGIQLRVGVQVDNV